MRCAEFDFQSSASLLNPDRAVKCDDHAWMHVSESACLRIEVCLTEMYTYILRHRLVNKLPAAKTLLQWLRLLRHHRASILMRCGCASVLNVHMFARCMCVCSWRPLIKWIDWWFEYAHTPSRTRSHSPNGSRWCPNGLCENDWECCRTDAIKSIALLVWRCGHTKRRHNNDGLFALDSHKMLINSCCW